MENGTLGIEHLKSKTLTSKLARNVMFRQILLRFMTTVLYYLMSTKFDS